MKKKAAIVLQKKGFEFSFVPEACGSCSGKCCCGESGYIWINQSEIHNICSFLKISVIDFIRKYSITINNRLSIKERFNGNDYECIFFDAIKKQCAIYQVRPKQCKQYPFWEYFIEHLDQLIKECPGIKLHS